MRFKLFLLTFLILIQIAGPCTLIGNTNKNPEYIKENNDRILIFRKKFGIKEIAYPMFFTILGLGCFGLTILKKVNKKGISISKKEKNLMRISGTIFFALGAVGLYYFYHNNSNIHKPLIILDKKGIYHEKWEDKIYWFNIKNISFIKIHEITQDQYGWKYDHGFFWRIEIITKQQKSIFIDEHSTQMGKKNRRELSDAGGELGQMILQHYNKYKKTTDIIKKI